MGLHLGVLGVRVPATAQSVSRWNATGGRPNGRGGRLRGRQSKARAGTVMTSPPKERSTAVLDVRGMQFASEQNVVAAVLGRRPGVLEVEVNAVAQTATVVFDPGQTSLAELRGWVTECGYHCAGQSVPAHVCDPMAEPDPAVPGAVAVPATGHRTHHPAAAPAAQDAHASLTAG